jgi:hypothetical protein
MDRACDKQKTICGLADQIKIEKGEEIKDECDVKVGHFVRAVNLEYRVQKGTDITKAMQGIMDEAVNSIDSIQLFSTEEHDVV